MSVIILIVIVKRFNRASLAYLLDYIVVTYKKSIVSKFFNKISCQEYFLAIEKLI